MGLYQPEFVSLQVFGNILLSLAFVLYLAHFKPFFDEKLNKLNLLNEVLYIVISMHQIAFTDHNSVISAKLTMSWSMVILALLSLVVNVYFVVISILPDIKRLYLRFRAVPLRKRSQKEFFEAKRKQLI
jgi:hypothetical protein